jgi:acetyltransferase-like isoleucine patch superfamily enzyme
VKLQSLVRRHLIPGFVNSLRCYLRYGAAVSPRAEVEITAGVQLGKGTRISAFSKIKAGSGALRIGARTDVATGCFLSASQGDIEIGSDVLIGPNTAILSSSYVYDQLGVPLAQQGHAAKATRIADRTFIGANCVILDGAQIGADVIVTPGSVVGGRVPDAVVVSGNPARIIFRRR